MGYANALAPRDLYVNEQGLAVFGTHPKPAGTSSYYWRFFKFNATTPEGKNMLAVLLMAMDSTKKIDLWYVESTDAGKDETNGATEATLAKATCISIP